MPRLQSTSAYDKKLRKFAKKRPDLRNKYLRVLRLLEADPYHPSLKLHKLHGPLSHLYAVSINYQYRISLEFEIKEDYILLINIGSHEEVY